MTSGDNSLENSFVCRFCGLEKSLGKFIFSFEAAKIGLLSKIKRLFPDEIELVSVDTNLPKFICDSCEMILDNFEAFRNTVKQVQQILLKKLQSKTVDNSHDNDVSFNKSQHICLATQKENSLLVTCNDEGNLICYSCNVRLRNNQIPKNSQCNGICSACGYKDDICKFLRKPVKFVCPKCSKKNPPTKDDSLERKFECDLCKKSYVTKSHLNRHRRTHFDTKSYICNDCGASFWQKSTLQTHSLIHKKIMPFSCKWCGQTFRHKATLISHVMSIHGVTSTTGSLYECDKCNKKFVHKEKLDRHLRSHSGEKPFKCDVCHKYFSQRINLRTHFKKHENESQYANVPQVTNNAAVQGDLIQELLSFDNIPVETDSLPTFPIVNDQCRKENDQMKTNNTDLYFNASSSSYMIYSSNSILYDLDDPVDASTLPSFSRLNSNDKSQLVL